MTGTRVVLAYFTRSRMICYNIYWEHIHGDSRYPHRVVWYQDCCHVLPKVIPYLLYTKMSSTHTCDHWYLDLCRYRTRLKLTCCQWGHRALTPVFTGTWHVVSILQDYNVPSHMRMPNIHTYPHRYLDYSEVLHKVTPYCSTRGSRASHGFIDNSTWLVINILHNYDVLFHMRMVSTHWNVRSPVPGLSSSTLPGYTVPLYMMMSGTLHQCSLVPGLLSSILQGYTILLYMVMSGTPHLCSLVPGLLSSTLQGYTILLHLCSLAPGLLSSILQGYTILLYMMMSGTPHLRSLVPGLLSSILPGCNVSVVTSGFRTLRTEGWN